MSKVGDVETQYAIRAKRVLDPQREDYLEDAVVVTSGGRIESVLDSPHPAQW